MTLLPALTTDPRRLPRATALAAVAAVAVWAGARAAGTALLVRRGSTPVGVPVGAVVLAVVGGGLAAAGLAHLARRARDPRRTYAGLCAVGLALGCAPPLLAAATPATALWLLAMHAAAAAVLVPAGLPGGAA